MRVWIFLGLIVILFSGCADSVEMTIVPSVEPVGFWYGLWHGMIAVIAFIVSLFDDSVAVYAVYNNGGWYDFGFLLGLLSIWGGGSRAKGRYQTRKKKPTEWDEVSAKVEAKVMRNLKAWAEDETVSKEDEEWNEIKEKVEQKLKRKIREWAETE